MPVWNYKKYGTAVDPVHKSHLNDITGEYGCDARFKRAMDEQLAGRMQDAEEHGVNGKAAAGNASHEVIARVLDSDDARERLLSGTWKVSFKQVEDAYREEFEHEVGRREVRWYKDRPDKIHTERAHMITGLLNNLHTRVAEVLLAEGGFIVKLEDIWLSGHVDLLYRPHSMPLGIAQADWKTGAQKPHVIELDHGWESGIYSEGCRAGYFIDRASLKRRRLPDGQWEVIAESSMYIDHSLYWAQRKAMELALIQRALASERTLDPEPLVPTFGQFPDELWYVHLGDYVPYQKSGDKKISRREDVEYYQLRVDDKVEYKAGDLRGPAWLPVKRSESDVPRLATQLRNIVGTVRMGRFTERLGEKCVRCPFKDKCLTGGYQVRGAEKDELRALASATRGLDIEDGLSLFG